MCSGHSLVKLLFWTIIRLHARLCSLIFFPLKQCSLGWDPFVVEIGQGLHSCNGLSDVTAREFVWGPSVRRLMPFLRSVPCAVGILWANFSSGAPVSSLHGCMSWPIATRIDFIQRNHYWSGIGQCLHSCSGLSDVTVREFVWGPSVRRLMPFLRSVPCAVGIPWANFSSGAPVSSLYGCTHWLVTARSDLFWRNFCWGEDWPMSAFLQWIVWCHGKRVCLGSLRSDAWCRSLGACHVQWAISGQTSLPGHQSVHCTDALIDQFDWIVFGAIQSRGRVKHRATGEGFTLKNPSAPR